MTFQAVDGLRIDVVVSDYVQEPAVVAYDYRAFGVA
jgi:hypothetical protein